MKFLLYIFRIKAVFKTIAVFILLNFLFGILYPSISYAILTNGASQPETVGYQSAGSSDNVNMVTGSFYYNVPITSIPEYPMSIGYSSGMGMDDEASCFGFGFNGFSGAINRNAMGIPDDIDGSNKEYKYENNVMWEASATASIGGGFGVGIGIATIGPQASVSFTSGYNNYSGFYGAIGYSASVSASLKGFVSVGLGVNLSNDSRADGIGGGVGLNVSLLSLVDLNVDKSFNSSKVNSSISVFGVTVQDSDNSNFSNQGNAASYLSPLANVVATSNSIGISLSLSIAVPIPPSFAIFVTAGLDGSYNQYSYNNQTLQKNAYGFIYLQDYDRSNLSHISDFTVEGEDSWSESNRTNPVYLQKDFFSANCGGLSGAMQFVSENYGIVSRNKQRQNVVQVKINALTVHTERNEVFPWHNVTKAVRNDDFDILSFLKSDPKNESSADFDNTMFRDEVLENLNQGGQKFLKSKTKMKLRFKGDMAGDFNLGSRDFKDFDPLKFKTVNVGDQSGNKRLVFFGYIKDMPMAKTEATKTDGSQFDPNGSDQVAGGIKSATKIDYYTIDDILGATSTGLKGNNAVFYSHDKLNSSVDAPIYPDNITKFNILQSLADTKLAKQLIEPNFGQLIGDIRITKTDGSKYIFNLPAFAQNGSKQLSLNGTKTSTPIAINNGTIDDYKTTSDKNRNKSTITDNYSYPYAWMLTAILGHDYIDIDNIPGPSDGDLGHWVKFKYLKVSDNYRWRYPFASMDHNPGALHIPDDDLFSVSSGKKEIYYLEAIESRNYVAKYFYGKRSDAIAAPFLANGDAVNTLKASTPTTSPNTLPSIDGSYQYFVGNIQLYNKHPFSDQSKIMNATSDVFGKIIKSTYFSYDYSISSNIINNKNNPGATNSGKLTLKKIQHYAYDENGNSFPLPSYQFYYPTTDPILNPSFDPKLKDGWGNYNADAKNIESGSNVPLYSGYNTTSKVQADVNAKVFQLNSIKLPTGGAMSIDYESGGYSKVQDQKCFVMRKITALSTSSDNSASKTDVTIDVTDLVDNSSGNPVSALNKLIKPGDNLYGEVAFYQDRQLNTTNNNKYIVNEQEFENDYNTNLVVAADPGTVPTQIGDRYYQKVSLSLKTTNIRPFYSKFETFIFKKSEIYKNSISGISGQSDSDSPLDAAKKIIGNLKLLLDDVSSTQKNNFLSVHYPGSITSYDNYQHFNNYKICPQYSYLRIPVYKERFTGARVKNITLSDEFKLSSSTINEGNNFYKTNYFYDDKGDGTGVSTGVASIEPMGGPSSTINIFKTKGAGFYASPAIYYGKVTVETGYDAPLNGKYPRKKGKTQYQFYTPGDRYDDGLKLKFEDNFKSLNAKDITPKTANSQFYLLGILAWLKIHFKIFGVNIYIQIPIPLPLFVDWQRWDDYHTNSYSYTDITDLYGKPKRISQLDANGKELSYQKFNYAGRDEAVSVLDGLSGNTSYTNDPFNDPTKQLNMRPGRYDQIWSEAYYAKETQVDYMLLYMKAVTNRHFNFISMKNVYVPPILKSIVTSNTFENFKDSTANTKFDYFTGQAIETQSDDGNGNIKISRNIPAYWKYSSMGPAYSQMVNYSDPNAPTTSNRLTEDVAEYMYLNQSISTSLLSAKVTEWSPNLNYQRSAIASFSSYNLSYYFDILEPQTLKDLYNNTGNIRNSIHTSPQDFVKNNLAPTFRPVRNYVFKAPITDANKLNGTYDLTNKDFNFTPLASQDAGWILQQENTLFSKDGGVVESRNIINQYGSNRLSNCEMMTGATASNAKKIEMVFDGAENIYNVGSNLTKFTDNLDLNLLTAVTKNGNDPASIYTFSLLSSILLKPNTNALIIDVQTPVDNSDKILGRINNVVFTEPNSGKPLQRTLLICKDRNNEPFVMTNRGEPFNGLYILKGGVVNNLNSFRLVIDKRYLAYNSANLENLYSSTTTISISTDTGIETCGPNAPDKSYGFKDDNVKAHTGSQVFVLEQTGQGTKYQIPGTSTGSRKYSAFVWVHSSSSPQTYLVVKVGATTTEANLSSAYVTAGDWSLLRINIDVVAGSPFEAYVENRGGGRSVYDDFRVQPMDAKMEATIYDPLFGRVAATLNNENMATWYSYDVRGRLIEVLSEVQNTGPVTVKKYQYKDQKPD